MVRGGGEIGVELGGEIGGGCGLEGQNPRRIWAQLSV